MTKRSDFPFLSPPEQPDELGRLGSYRVLGVVGEGGMGKVLLAEDLKLQRKVALKVMSNKIAKSKNSRERFLREARAQAAVHHDNVATIFEVNEINSTPFLAMELLKGKSLEQVLGRGHRFSPKQVVWLARQVARGLDAAHKQGIVHRDIKPANIWIESEGRPKILDFGLVALEGPSDGLARRGAVVGTPGYLAPEQARDEPVDDRADIYSLGIVMYEMLAGKLPFRSSSVPMILIAIATHSPQLLHEVDEGVPQPLSELIDRMLSKEPKDRPDSALAFIQELKVVSEKLDDVSSAGGESGAFQIAIDPDDEGSSRKSTASKAKKANKTKLPLYAVMGMVLCALIGLAVYVLSQPADSVPGYAGTPKTQPPKLQPKPVKVTPSMLKALKFESVVAESTQLIAGEYAVVNFRLVNTASDALDDPFQLAGKAKVAAKVRAFLLPESGTERPADMFPISISGRRLPRSGASIDQKARFETAKISPGRYTVQLRLSTGSGERVAQVETKLRVLANHSSGSLAGFEIIRTHQGKGADASISRGQKELLGGKDSIVIKSSGAEKSYGYIRFDLSRWGRPTSELSDAVVMLSTSWGGKSKQELQLWGLPEEAIGDWNEIGDAGLKWAESPTKDGFSRAKFLCSVLVGQSQITSKGVDNVRFFDPELTEFLRSFKGKQVTFVVQRKTQHKDKTAFVSKESGNVKRAPALALKGN